jgi:hypothetical protein
MDGIVHEWHAVSVSVSMLFLLCSPSIRFPLNISIAEKACIVMEGAEDDDEDVIKGVV